ncbi:alpha/beta hydrolase [Rhizobium giardinii]|uniref:Esterase/lipase superfamily enzyme n=1 Tax=Rhizobium giardinii TaxID=56731 RepID=A0A7W8UDV5_9HYPH|nr:alpha/beta fold hydrolase [Rhizobium giardinii]MBB5537556.1 esterase/lipase superfamily enzyme [Rhizobium giardinii]
MSLNAPRSFRVWQRIGRARPISARDRALPVLVVLSLVVNGCAARVENVLQPLAASASDASRVDMLVATTRRPSEKPGQVYSGERGTAISLNTVVVSVPPDRNRKVGNVQWPSRVPANPEKEFAVLEIDKAGSEGQVLQWFRKNRNAKRQVVIFVHGFNNTYADAVFRLAQIVHDSGTDATPVLFTWPSRARVFDYLYDKESANYSRRALEDLILQAARSPDVEDVTILAHSMGAWLAAEALRGVSMRERSIPAKVKNVVLASPDIDIDVFRRQFVEMGPKRPHFTILTSAGVLAVGSVDLAVTAVASILPAPKSHSAASSGVHPMARKTARTMSGSVVFCLAGALRSLLDKGDDDASLRSPPQSSLDRLGDVR